MALGYSCSKVRKKSCEGASQFVIPIQLKRIIIFAVMHYDSLNFWILANAGQKFFLTPWILTYI